MNTFVRRCVMLAGASVLAGALSAAVAGPAFADPPDSPGQPNRSCEAEPSTPGNLGTTNNPGSPFSPTGHAGDVYAGEQDQNSKNPKSVSQYDVACFQVSNH